MASSRFDEYLDVVQRAVELQGYILDRSLLPWKKAPDSSSTPSDRLTKLRDGNGDLDVTIESTTPPKPKDSRPGLMVFKHAFPGKGQPPKAPSLLLTFLVPESPISGIHKQAFVHSLDLIDSYFHHKLTHEVTENPDLNVFTATTPAGALELMPGLSEKWAVLHIIAPCFNSSQRSLELAIGAWGKRTTNRYHFRIISNNTNQIDQDRLIGLFPAGSGSPHKLTFQSMVHEIKALKNAMIDYLTEGQRYPRKEIAILIESNTGLAQALVQDERKKGVDLDGAPVDFLFPLQVSEVRKAYEKAGLLRGGKADERAAPERLRIPADEAGAPRDLPRSFTPATSAAIDEMALTQVLTTIARRPYQAVGIIATDPYDVVFLAREVRRFCPNVRLFTISSDLLLARPAEVIDLRGMLVASTYPLYPSNQWITTPFRDGARVFFSNRGAQGLFNATVAHLWEMTADLPAEDEPPVHGPELLEFGLPYDLDFMTFRKPPVWISAVGERGLYPVTLSSSEDQSAYLYNPATAPEGRLLLGWPGSPQAAQDAMKAMTPSPHILFWLLYLVLFLACVGVTAVTWLYVEWSTDEKKLKLRSNIGIFGLTHVLKYLMCEVADKSHRAVRRRNIRGRAYQLWVDRDRPANDDWVDWLRAEVQDATPYQPQAKYRDRSKNKYPPSVGAGIHIVLINLLTLGVSYYIGWHFVMAMSPYFLNGEEWRFLLFLGLITLPPALVTASTILALLECTRLLGGKPQITGRRWYGPRRTLASLSRRKWIKKVLKLKTHSQKSRAEPLDIKKIKERIANERTRIEFLKKEREDYGNKINNLFRTCRVPIFTVLFAAITYAWLRLALDPSRFGSPEWRLAYERLTNLPSGVSSIFPVLFLSAAVGAWIYSHLSRRRLYRLSYLPSESQDNKNEGSVTHFEEILINMRKTREEVDRLMATWHFRLADENPFLLCAIGLLLLHIFIRSYVRGLPASLEGIRFDKLFWSLFLWVFLTILWRARQLRVLWRTIRRMLHLAVDLPLSEAYDRIPTRFKGWFFGEEDFKVREQIILQQSAALRHRSSDELAKLFCKLETFSRPSEHQKKPWDQELADLQKALENSEGTLDSTRAVYTFLSPIWRSLPVEDVPRRSHGGEGKDRSADWLASWPLTPKDRSEITDQEHLILRDWVRMAEDLIALQIVRWFAPALSQILPIMQFLVLGSISLLLAVTCYPFDHLGWLMTVMVSLILFVAAVVVDVLLGVNRDELISRVSDTTPGRLTFDSNFVSSILTMFVPLIGALLAISFDLSDLLHAWFGPLFQLF